MVLRQNDRQRGGWHGVGDECGIHHNSSQVSALDHLENQAKLEGDANKRVNDDRSRREKRDPGLVQQT
jgi:hypothetical protein